MLKFKIVDKCGPKFGLLLVDSKPYCLYQEAMSGRFTAQGRDVHTCQDALPFPKNEIAHLLSSYGE